MIYNLSTKDFEYHFDIMCSITNRPYTVEQLLDGISNGSIHWSTDYSDGAIQYENALNLPNDTELITNYQRRGAPTVYFNWINWNQ
jgi:hypothetical protein